MTISLFESVYHDDEGGQYDERQAKAALEPYLKYLYNLRDRRRDMAVSWRFRRPDSKHKSGAGRGPTQCSVS